MVEREVRRGGVNKERRGEKWRKEWKKKILFRSLSKTGPLGDSEDKLGEKTLQICA